MSGFNDYVSGKGTTESPNEDARNMLLLNMQQQGLRQVFSQPLERMTHIIYEDKAPNSAPPKTRYMTKWRGNSSA